LRFGPVPGRIDEFRLLLAVGSEGAVPDPMHRKASENPHMQNLASSPDTKYGSRSAVLSRSSW
jgi:hypothetical protein